MILGYFKVDEYGSQGVTKVFVDGVEIKNCVEVDEILGFAVHYVEKEGGGLVCHENGVELIKAVSYGRVHIEHKRQS